MFKGNLRQIWEENVPFNYSTIEGEVKDSVEKYCKKSGYKYFSHFVSGHNYEFNEILIDGNAVSFEQLFL